VIARLVALAAAVLLGCISTAAFASATIGAAAPDFTLTDSNGKPHTLADYKGKIVVLEWNNPDCPFVRKHYGSGNMQKQQTAATAAGAVWLTINSGAHGKQGDLDGPGADAYVAKVGGKQTAYLLDADGKVGHLYGAKTTPHIYVIDKDGVLRYMGGIDSIASTDVDDLAKATQYVPQVLAELAAGKPVSVTTSQPYGCSVKYGS
jgi:ABC-type Fe3+-hydroxamate transport system substrate-binding protein